MLPRDDDGRLRTGDLSGPDQGLHQPSLATRLSDVRPHHVKWLWPRRLPLGKLAVLDGDPGLGKSTITMDLAARITTGRPMPGDTTRPDPRGVLLLSAEDDLGDTIRPRLEAAGTDLDRVISITGIPEGGGERPVSLPSDLKAVEAAIVEHEVALSSSTR